MSKSSICAEISAKLPPCRRALITLAGEIIMPMDADLQNDPVDIPLLLNKLAEGYDVASGWRKDRQDKEVCAFSLRAWPTG